jgi:uncharacterized iron-regulated membrane protein
MGTMAFFAVVLLIGGYLFVGFWHIGGYRPRPRRRRRRRIADRHPDLEQEINALDQAAPLAG